MIILSSTFIVNSFLKFKDKTISNCRLFVCTMLCVCKFLLTVKYLHNVYQPIYLGFVYSNQWYLHFIKTELNLLCAWFHYILMRNSYIYHFFLLEWKNLYLYQNLYRPRARAVARRYPSDDKFMAKNFYLKKKMDRLLEEA